MIDLIQSSSLRAIAVCLLVLPVVQGAAGQNSNDGWHKADPDSLGVDSEHLRTMTSAIQSGEFGNIHAVLIERAGKLVYEKYFSGVDESWGRSLGHVDFSPGTRHDLRSVTKSIVATLVGVALQRDHIDSTDARLSALLPGHAHLLTGQKQKITLENILTMSAGFEWNEDIPYSNPMNDERRLTESDDPVAFVLQRPLVQDPGNLFKYNGALTQLLAFILEGATGAQLEEFAQEALFEPLGIHDVEWLGDLNGVPSAASGLRMTARDLAKIGNLYLNDGKWNGAQVISENWIRHATTPHIELDTSNDPGFVLTGGYGYQWWYNEFQTRDGPRHVVAAIGNGGQRIFLIPELDVAVTMLSGLYNDPNHFWTPEILLLQHVIPAVKSQK